MLKQQFVSALIVPHRLVQILSTSVLGQCTVAEALSAPAKPITIKYVYRKDVNGREWKTTID